MNYKGKLIGEEEALELEKKHEKAGEGCFMYFFNHRGKKLWFVYLF